MNITKTSTGQAESKHKKSKYCWMDFINFQWVCLECEKRDNKITGDK